MPHPTARRGKDAASQASDARLAAEAAFSRVLRDDGVEPVVVVKRKRLIDEGADLPAPVDGISEPDPVERAPRVFRVAPALPDQDAAASPAGEPEPLASGAPSRVKRRTRHGKVTIIRPEPTLATRSGHAESPGAAAIAQGPSSDGSPPFGVDAELAAQYEALTARIEALQRTAADLKRAEAAHAAAWIKRAIAQHGLTAEDLGL